MESLGPLSPQVVVNDASAGTRPWNNPGNAKISDDTYATATLLEEFVASQYLKATDFGFKLPAGATIVGVKLDVEKHADGEGTGINDPGVADWEIKLVVGGAIIGEDNKGAVTLWPLVDTIFSYGGDSELWGLGLTPEKINLSDFGVAFRARGDQWGGMVSWPEAFVDHMQLTVYYEPPPLDRIPSPFEPGIIKDIYSGDPYLTLGPDGATLTFVGGQPAMDQGFENQAIISLFTEEGWEGNAFISDPDKKIGSDFMAATRKPITLNSLSDIEQSAVRALKSPAFGRVTATAINPTSNSLKVDILIQPPGQDSRTIILTRHGLNWQAQALNPAHERV